MEQKLQRLLYSLPTRTAWIIIGCCAAFWLVCLTGILTPPVSIPPHFTLLWFYAMLMLILASGIAVIGSTAVLVVKRGGRALPARPVPESAVPSPAAAPPPAPPPPAPAEPDDAAADQLAGLGRMMDDPDNLDPPDAVSAEGARPEPAQLRKASKPKPRKPRR